MNRVPILFVAVFVVMLSLPACSKQEETTNTALKTQSKGDHGGIYGPAVAA